MRLGETREEKWIKGIPKIGKSVNQRQRGMIDNIVLEKL